MITAQLKDDILVLLCRSNYMSIRVNTRNLSKESGASIEELEAILRYFEFLDLMRCRRMLGGWVDIVLNVQAHDVVIRGGFVAQEELLKQNIEKLILELEDLKTSMPEKAERISTIIGGISTAISMFL